MTQILNILAEALSSTPTAIIPFIVTLAMIGYLSFKIYQEFRKLYKKINDDVHELTNRVAETERSISLTDSKTMMLSQKLERIEESLEKMNNVLVELSTTIKLMREDRVGRCSGS